MPAAPFPTFEQERLNALLSFDLLDTPRSKTFDDLVVVASKLMNMPIAAISLVAERRQWFKAICGLQDLTETPRELAFCAHAILDPGHALTIEDATRDPRVADNRLVTGRPFIRSYAGIPLLVGNDLPIGTLCVLDTKPRPFVESELARLASLARMVSKSLQLHGTVHKLKQRHATGQTPGGL